MMGLTATEKLQRVKIKYWEMNTVYRPEAQWARFEYFPMYPHNEASNSKCGNTAFGHWSGSTGSTN